MAQLFVFIRNEQSEYELESSEIDDLVPTTTPYNCPWSNLLSLFFECVDLVSRIHQHEGVGAWKVCGFTLINKNP